VAGKEISKRVEAASAGSAESARAQAILSITVILADYTREMPLSLKLLPGRYAVCRLRQDAEIPAEFFSITRTADELSVVCEESVVPAESRVEAGWRILGVEGPLDFALTGILLSIARPLAEAGVSIFAVSTFDTDYVFVKDADLERASTALRAAGHTIA